MSITDSLQIHVNSKHANFYNNNLTSDCEFSLPNIELVDGHYIYLSIPHVIIPYSFYNIISTNNTLSITQNSIEQIITIPVGNMNAYTLMNYLTLMISNTTATYNTSSNKFTLTNSLYDFTINSSSTCLELLGFTGNNTSTSKILTSNNSINLSRVHCICLSSSTFQTNNVLATLPNNGTILCSIPVGQNPPFGLISHMSNNGFKTNTFENSLSSIHLKLIDQNGMPIDLNGNHFSATIQIDSVKFIE